MRVIFMGTPDFSVPALAEILGAGHDVIAVYSQPPRPAGRGMDERKSPVHEFAEKAGLQVRVPTTLKDPQIQAEFSSLEADVAVVIAYGLLLPVPVLSAPVHGCLNAHASLLPRWRGAAPIQRAIMAGDKETGVCIMQMDEGLDTGPVCLMEHVAIGPEMTAGELHDQLAQLSASAIVRALAALSRGGLNATAQPDGGVTYAAKITKDETRIDFSRPAEIVHNQIRGLSPFPGAWFELPGERRVRVKVLRSRRTEASGRPGHVVGDDLTIACASGAVQLMRLQRAGKAAMGVREFLRGTNIAVGQNIA